MLTTHLLEDFNGNRIVIDATEDARVAEHYPRWLTLGAHNCLVQHALLLGPFLDLSWNLPAGAHIVSSNKLATGGPPPTATHPPSSHTRAAAPEPPPQTV